MHSCIIKYILARLASCHSGQVTTFGTKTHLGEHKLQPRCVDISYAFTSTEESLMQAYTWKLLLHAISTGPCMLPLHDLACSSPGTPGRDRAGLNMKHTSKRTACVPEVGSVHGSHKHAKRLAGKQLSSRASTRTCGRETSSLLFADPGGAPTLRPVMHTGSWKWTCGGQATSGFVPRPPLAHHEAV